MYVCVQLYLRGSFLSGKQKTPLMFQESEANSESKLPPVHPENLEIEDNVEAAVRKARIREERIREAKRPLYLERYE